MIASIPRLARWEWFKLRSRRMPWVMLLVAALVVQLMFWGVFAFYASGVLLQSMSSSYSSERLDLEISLTCADLQGEGIAYDDYAPEAQAELRQMVDDMSLACDAALQQHRALREALTLPGSLVVPWVLIQGFWVVLLMILSASTVGVEYGWGTLRMVLAKGVNRSAFMAAKFLTLAGMNIAGMLAVAASLAVSSLIATALTANDGDGAAVAAAPGAPAIDWGTVARMLGGAMYGWLPYILLGMFLAAVTRSSATAISLALGYYILGEQVLATVLSGLFEWYETIRPYVLVHAVDDWLADAAMQLSIGIGGDGGPSLFIEPDRLRAFLVLLGYIVVLGSATLWAFRRQDMAGARDA